MLAVKAVVLLSWQCFYGSVADNPICKKQLRGMWRCGGWLDHRNRINR
jgi:hypothetical protein